LTDVKRGLIRHKCRLRGGPQLLAAQSSIALK
jgi:hypothetical protein